MTGVRWPSWPELLLPLMLGLSLLAGPAVAAEEPSAQEQTLEEQMPEGESLAEQSLDEAPMDIEALNALKRPCHVTWRTARRLGVRFA